MTDYRTGALYIRVSTHDQDELSPDAQSRLCLEYAKSNNIIIPPEYIFTESVSGRKAKNRQQFQNMIALAKSKEHPVDVIVVWKFSRFARNQEESIVYKSMLKKDGVDVLSVSEPLVDGPFGSLIERIIEWMDEYYSIRLSGEVLRGMSEKALKNGYQCSPPLGYDAIGCGKPYTINEKEFEIIDYIFEQFDVYDRDETSIARSLNNMGRRTKRGTCFEKRTVDRILKNPFYYGLVKWNDISFLGTHETRLTEAQFLSRMEKINRRYSPAKRKNVSTCTHWLSGLLKCGYCGASLSFNRSNHSPGFQCWRYSKGAHNESSSVSERIVTAAVYEYFEGILNGNDFQYHYHAPVVSENLDRKNAILEELKKISVREHRIQLAFENEIDTLEEYAANKKRLQSERADLEQELSELENPISEEPSREDIMVRIKTVYDIIRDPDVDFEMKGNAMRSIIESITYRKETHELEFIFYI